jgi:hypothetical protein
VRVLSAEATKLLDMVPPYYRGDPLSQAIMQAVGGRIAEAETLAFEVRRRFVLPQYAADDEYGSLAYWERLMRLPVNPGADEARRKAVLLAHWRKRRARTGAGWVELLTLLLGTTLWSHAEGPVPGHVTITISNLATSYAANQIALLARQITPAGLVINFVFTDGFLVGYSTVGSGPLL